jgi:uncharacterized protein YaeQ
MTSDAQTSANRRNALSSTGPATPEGKKKVRRNALRHGLYADQLTALDEDGDDFVAYAEALADALQPQDTYEAMLVRRVALASWRSDRLAKLEAALLKGEQRAEAWRRNSGELPLDVWPEVLAPLARHDAALDRSLQRAMALLERYRQQARRSASPAAATTKIAEQSQIS